MVFAQRFWAVSAVGSNLTIVIAKEVGVEKHIACGAIPHNGGMGSHFTPLSGVTCTSRSEGSGRWRPQLHVTAMKLVVAVAIVKENVICPIWIS